METQLGQMIRRRRLELGLTQEQLAARIDDEDHITQTDISRIEIGRVKLPRVERLERLATALDLPLGELLARSGWTGYEVTPTNSRMEALLDQLADACYAIDRDGRYVYVNQPAADLLGHSRDDLLGHTVRERSLEAGDWPLAREVDRTLYDREPVRLVRHDAASQTWFQIDLYPAPDGLIVFARDVTARMRGDVGGTDIVTDAQHDRCFGDHAPHVDAECVADVGHELRGLAMMLVGSVQLVRRQLDSGHRRDSRMLTQCLDEIEAAATAVADRIEHVMTVGVRPLEVPAHIAHDVAFTQHTLQRHRKGRHRMGARDSGQPGR